MIAIRGGRGVATGQQSRKAMLKAARESLDEKNKERTVTTEAIATAQGDMTNMNAVLNDDRTYLKDLTIKCELKAKQWDQRSSMRSAELSAITQALTVLQGSVRHLARSWLAKLCTVRQRASEFSSSVHLS